MTLQDVWTSLLGGALIGLAAAWLLIAEGRIAGISGILGRLLARPDRDTPWRLAFVVGLLAGPVAYLVASGRWPAVDVTASWPTLAVAGLLVGFGTRIGSGCTSGHGVCGLARLSPRSLAAVLLFMTSAMLTVFVVRHGGVA